MGGSRITRHEEKLALRLLFSILSHDSTPLEMKAVTAKDSIQSLRDDFRHQLEMFYAALKLAPPYHSVEKAIATLTATLKTMAPDERARLVSDPALCWEEYAKAFVESGLYLKHRGIIAGLVRSKRPDSLPPEHDHFLNAHLRIKAPS